MEKKKSQLFLFCVGAVVSLLLIFICTLIGRLFSFSNTNLKQRIDVSINDTYSEYQDFCTYHNCFDVYSCGGIGTNKITIYIYPEIDFFDENGVLVNPIVSKEFKDLVNGIKDSEFYTSDARTACLFMPYIDFLNQERMRVDYISRCLPKLPFWRDGRNHLIFNMLPGSSPDFIPKLEVDTGFALVAGGGFNAYTFRYSYDISIPVYSPWLSSSKIHADSDRKWFIVSSQPYLTKKSFEIMMTVAKEHKDILIAQACSENSNLSTGSWRCNKDGVLFKNPEFLQEGEFCLVFRGARLGQPVLIETLASGCIPVIVIDKYVLPFSDVLEWKRAAILLYEHQLPDIYVILKSLNPERIQSLKEHGRYFFDQYLGSMKKIGLTTLDIISERVYPLQSKGYDGWNVLPKSMSKPNVFILPMGPPKSQGFTAVVLTYNRLESLYAIIRNLAATPSLVHIVVVWNNQLKAPPSRDQWPEIRKPLTIIRSSKNILTNRFLPFKEIQTEAVLSLDDDINMLTIDELEFGYQVWREFPDRIVGFPSRTHTWSNISNSWVYDSEWGNSYSLVLTGASFYHKYWHHIYATDLPPAVKKFVDDHMNCEDIAMNFLVANKTGKSPIKVGPRKKFKCPSCTSEMLSADAGHLAERSLCVDYFSKEFGKLELKYAEFRADPVLYREDVPEDFKIYGNMGSL